MHKYPTGLKWCEWSVQKQCYNDECHKNNARLMNVKKTRSMLFGSRQRLALTNKLELYAYGRLYTMSTQYYSCKISLHMLILLYYYVKNNTKGRIIVQFA